MKTADRHTYDAGSLASVLHAFEEHYGMSSADFYRLHESREGLADMRGSVRQTWAGFYAEWLRMAPESNFSDQAARDLATA